MYFNLNMRVHYGIIMCAEVIKRIAVAFYLLQKSVARLSNSNRTNDDKVIYKINAQK